MTWPFVLQLSVLLLVVAVLTCCVMSWKGNVKIRELNTFAYGQEYVHKARATAEAQIFAAESYSCQIKTREESWLMYMSDHFPMSDSENPSDDVIAEIRKARAAFENMYPHIDEPNVEFVPRDQP